MFRFRKTIVAAAAAAAVIVPAGGARADTAEPLEQLRIMCEMKTGDFWITPYHLARCQDVRSQQGLRSRALVVQRDRRRAHRQHRVQPQQPRLVGMRRAQSQRQLIPCRSVNINGVDLHYELTGDSGPTLVLVHGAWVDHTSWRLVAPALAETHRVVRYDRRGHTLSAGTDIRHGSREQHEDDLAGLIEALDLGPVHLIGSSYGASVALAVAANRPDLVNSVFAARATAGRRRPPGVESGRPPRTRGHLVRARRRRPRARQPRAAVRSASSRSWRWAPDRGSRCRSRADARSSPTPPRSSTSWPMPPGEACPRRPIRAQRWCSATEPSVRGGCPRSSPPCWRRRTGTPTTSRSIVPGMPHTSRITPSSSRP